jgi:hypothetical protein
LQQLILRCRDRYAPVAQLPAGRSNAYPVYSGSALRTGSCLGTGHAMPLLRRQACGAPMAARPMLLLIVLLPPLLCPHGETHCHTPHSSSATKVAGSSGSQGRRRQLRGSAAAFGATAQRPPLATAPAQPKCPSLQLQTLRCLRPCGDSHQTASLPLRVPNVPRPRPRTCPAAAAAQAPAPAPAPLPAPVDVKASFQAPRPAAPSPEEALATAVAAIRRGEPQQLLVTFRSPKAPGDTLAAVKARVLSAALMRRGVALVYDYTSLPIVLVTVSNGPALDALTAHPDVAAVHANSVYTMQRPNGPPGAPAPPGGSAKLGAALATAGAVPAGAAAGAAPCAAKPAGAAAPPLVGGGMARQGFVGN